MTKSEFCLADVRVPSGRYYVLSWLQVVVVVVVVVVGVVFT